MLVIQRPTVEPLGDDDGHRQRFAIGPLEPGFGHTIGNSLRRTLLSSIPGAAITTVRFDDALHEFDTIAGITEDVTDIILNLKDIVLRSESEDAITVRLDVRGPSDVKAGDIKMPSEIEIVNPDQHVATLNTKGRLAIDLTIEKGRGYLTAERNQGNSTIGIIPIDAIFSPVRRVTFEVEPTRRAVDELRPSGPRHRDRRVDRAPRCAGFGRRHVALARRPCRQHEREPAGSRAR